MLATKPAARIILGIVATSCIGAARVPAPFAAAPGGIEALQAATPTVRLVAEPTPGRLVSGGSCGGARCTGNASQCFEPLEPLQAGNYVNVGSFFDKKQHSSNRHYFAKYFAPADSTQRYLLRGMSFFARYARTDSAGARADSVIFPFAGAVLTSARTPFLPKPQDLTQLQQVGIHACGTSTATCVDLSADHIVIAPGRAAWLVLNFPDLPDNVFVGVLADKDNVVDHPCDFLTQDAGDLWYRPDPVHTPFFDWGITVYTEPTTLKDGEQVQPYLWAQVKQLYR
jgi:hypothetical protein